jgi:multisubunit Na+/H+ antiporter MnhG subunit
MNIVLWVLQGLLALGFLAAGIPKTFQPIPELSKRLAWAKDIPEFSVRLIGIAEILGAIGLILPAALHIVTPLTLVATAGLGVVMLGAIVFHLARNEGPRISASLVLLILLALVFIGRVGPAPF